MNTFSIISAIGYALSTYRKHFLVLLTASVLVWSPMFLSLYINPLAQSKAQVVVSPALPVAAPQVIGAQSYQTTAEVLQVAAKPRLASTMLAFLLIIVSLFFSIGFMRLCFSLYDTGTVSFEKIIIPFGSFVKINAAVLAVTFAVMIPLAGIAFLIYFVMRPDVQNPASIAHFSHVLSLVMGVLMFLVCPFIMSVSWHFIDKGGSFFEGFAKSFGITKKYYFCLVMFMFTHVMYTFAPLAVVQFFMTGSFSFMTLYPSFASQLVSNLSGLILMPFSALTMVHVYRSLKD